MKMLLKAAVMIVAFGASACAGMPEMPAMPGFGALAASKVEAPESTAEAAVAPASAEPAQKDTIARAAELLAAGKDVEAKAVLQAVLVSSPRDPTAQKLPPSD